MKLERDPKPDRTASSQQTRDDATVEPLHKRVRRVKARWLQRIMYSDVKQTEKVFAFLVADHLNCVTLDAWPSQATASKLLHCSTKTIQRAADGLEQIGTMEVERQEGRSHVRYAPIFLPQDWDNPVSDRGQTCREMADTHVHQSSLAILAESSSTGCRWMSRPQAAHARYRSAERGKWEAELAQRLGRDGPDVLVRLASVDDRIVAELCRALCEGEVGQAELEAARLAAAQASVTGARS